MLSLYINVYYITSNFITTLYRFAVWWSAKHLKRKQELLNLPRIDLCRRLRKLHSHFDVRETLADKLSYSHELPNRQIQPESFGQRQFPGYETLSVDRSLLRNLSFILYALPSLLGIQSFCCVSLIPSVLSTNASMLRRSCCFKKNQLHVQETSRINSFISIKKDKKIRFYLHNII